MKRLNDYAAEFISKHPHLKEQVDDLVQLCYDEIEQSGLKEHEIDLAIDLETEELKSQCRKLYAKEFPMHISYQKQIDQKLKAV